MSGIRIDQLRLEPWGCFEDLTLDFGRPGALDLVVGPNAAGKSTMTRGIAGLLFGIEARSRDNHTFDYGDLRIGARISTEEGLIDVVRRKGRTGTLLDTEGEPLSDALLDPALGGLRREVFESLLLVDNEALKEGGAELLQGRGEVGSSLFAAAAGIASLHATIEGLDSKARELFNPRGRKDAVHDALRALKDAERRLRDATLRPRRHEEMETEIRRLDEDSAELADRIASLSAEGSDLERLRRVAPMVRRHGELAERLAGLDGTPELAVDSRETRIAAEGDLRNFEAELARVEQKRRAILEQAEECQVDEALIARRDEIEAVVRASSAAIKGAEDRPRLEREKAAAEERVRAACAAAGVDAAELEGLRRPVTVQGRLDDAVSAHGLLVERRDVALKTLARARKARTQADAILAETTEAHDPIALSASLKAARDLGSVDRHLADAVAEIERLGEAAERRFAGLSPRPASLDELATLRVPTVGEVDRLLEQRGSLERQERDLQIDQDRLQARRYELAHLQDEIDLGRSVPGPTVLAEARARREDSWSRLRVTVAKGDLPTTGQMDEHQDHMAKADAIADRQLEGTAELERATRLELDRAKLDREEGSQATRAEEIAKAQEEFGALWSDLWGGVDPTAPRPDAALEWLRRWEEILGLLDRRSEKQAAKAALDEQAAVHRRSLEAQLAELGIRPSELAFSELLRIAEDKVEDLMAGRRQRERVEDAVADAERALAEATGEATAAEHALEAWAAEWPEVLDAVGLPPRTTPDVATKISRSVAEGLDLLVQARELGRRIAGIERDRSAYATQVSILVADLANDLEDAEPTKAAALLGERLRRSQEEAAVRKTLDEQRASIDADVESAEESLLAARRKIETVLVAAGCEELADVPELEMRSTELRDLRRELRELEQRSVEAGERRFDELTREVANLDMAGLEARLAEVGRESEELGGRRDGLRQEVGAKEADLRLAELDTAANEAREDIELIKGEIRTLAGDYAAARLGSVVVRRAMERYRRLHENPLLARANGLFARITLGHFVELIVDHDDRDGAILVGRQRDGRRKRVGEMSSGTREQLFLALRIAAIERYVATTGPMPIVFDDAFLESDDERSERIFESLGELASATQVIVLTHRRQQAELGQRVLGRGVNVLELEGVAAPELRAAA